MYRKDVLKPRSVPQVVPVVSPVETPLNWVNSEPAGWGPAHINTGWSVPEFSVGQTAWQAPSRRKRVLQTPHIPQFYVPVSNIFGVV